MSKKTFVIGGDPQAHAIKIVEMRAYFKELDFSKPWKVTIESYARRRTTGQNALMWKWINEVADYVCEHTGMDSDDVHEFFKGKFLNAKIITIAGQEVESKSTKHLTTREMGEYMDRIHAWASTELGLTLPIPEDLGQR